MYQIAEENGVENLVAGAWGCGVFMQDPYTVATLLIGAARNYNIPNIYFAIPDRNSQNFRAYKQLIIARKDLNMSPGKLAMLLLLFFWKRFFGEAKKWFGKEMALCIIFHDWITKVVCRTELEKESPEGTLTCIGFRPMEAEEIYTIKGYFCPK